MLSKNDFFGKLARGACMLDGATGTALLAAGLPQNCCKELWILEHPEVITVLQRRYAEAGSQIIYAPTFLANSLALGRYGLENETESINARLVALSRSAASECLIAGNLTTLRMQLDTADEANFEQMVAVYRRQIRALADGGADLLAAETLLNPQEAEAILIAAEIEHALPVMISFALRPDGTLSSGHAAEQVFRQVEKAGAAAVGMNCIAADDALVPLVGRLKQCVSIPVLCKPNTGKEAGGVRAIDVAMFADVMRRCIQNGAALVGGCCGTTPEHIAVLKKLIFSYLLPGKEFTDWMKTLKTCFFNMTLQRHVEIFTVRFRLQSGT